MPAAVTRQRISMKAVIRVCCKHDACAGARRIMAGTRFTNLYVTLLHTWSFKTWNLLLLCASRGSVTVQWWNSPSCSYALIGSVQQCSSSKVGNVSQKNSQHLMQPDDSLPYSRKPVTYSKPQSDEYNTHTTILFLTSTLILSPHLHLKFPNNLFPSRFLTKASSYVVFSILQSFASLRPKHPHQHPESKLFPYARDKISAISMPCASAAQTRLSYCYVPLGNVSKYKINPDGISFPIHSTKHHTFHNHCEKEKSVTFFIVHYVMPSANN